MKFGCRRLTQTAGLLLAMTVCAGGQSGDADLQLRFADGLMVRGLYEHAIREYLVFQELNPGYEAMDAIDFRVAEAYLNLRNLVAAARAYHRVIERQPPSGYRHRAMLRRAEIHRLAERPQTAVKLLRELRAERPDPAIDDAAQYWLGRSLLDNGEREAAVTVWRDFLNSGRASAFTPFMALELGKTLAASQPDAFDEAVQWLRRVADDPPDARHGAEALYQLARLAERHGDDTRTADLIDDIRRLYRDDLRTAQLMLPGAWVYYRIGRYADSLNLCNEALEAESNESDIDKWLYLKANNQRRLGNYAMAAATYSALLERFPKSSLASGALMEKAQSEYQLGEHRRALETMRAAPVADTHRLPALWLKATAHDMSGADDEAVQNYRLIIERFPDSEQAYEASYRLAMLLRRRGDARPAAEAFQRVAARYPDKSLAPVALMASAELLRALDRHAEAVRDYARLLQNYPEHTLTEKAIYHKAVSEAHLDRTEAAVISMRELMERFPESELMADAAFTLGLLYFRTHDYAAAEQAFGRALAARPGSEMVNRIKFRRALALQQLERESEAAGLFQELLDDPGMQHFDPPLLEWLAERLRAENRPGDALRAADLLVERAGVNLEWLQVGHALAGLAAIDAGDPDLARSRLETAADIEARTPFAAEAAVRIGELLLAGGRIADARHRFRQGETRAQGPDMESVRARALLGLGDCHAAEENLTDANRYYALVGLTYDIPGLSERALRRAAETFDQLNRATERDRMLEELATRYGLKEP